MPYGCDCIDSWQIIDVAMRVSIRIAIDPWLVDTGIGHMEGKYFNSKKKDGEEGHAYSSSAPPRDLVDKAFKCSVVKLHYIY